MGGPLIRSAARPPIRRRGGGARRPIRGVAAVVLACALVYIATATALPAPASARPATLDARPEVLAQLGLLVRLTPGVGSAEASALWAQAGVVPRGGPTSLGVQRVMAQSHADREAARALLSRDPRVRYAENPRVLRAAEGTAAAIPNDPLYPQEWWLDAIDIRPAWEYVGLREPVTVAVLDTGVALDHPDLAGVLVPGRNIVAPGSPPEDDSTSGHGTHVAGIVGASTNDGVGMAGVAWGSRIMPVKVLNDAGRGDDATVAEGIAWAVDHGAGVVNLSLTGAEPSCGATLTDGVNYAVSRGVVVVAAAGNDTGPVRCPAALPNVISVGSVDRADAHARSSNFGPSLQLVAPGVSITSSVPPAVNVGGYATLSGTSMAAPMVSGAVALLRMTAPSLSPADVAAVLTATARDVGPPGRDPEYGYGVLDVGAAILASANLAEELSSTPEILVRDQAGATGAATLSFSATVPVAARISVEREDGALVRELFAGALPPGPVSYDWDGLDGGGAPAPDGWYRFRIGLDGPAGRTQELVRPVGVSAALASAAVRPTTFSPNGDGRYDTATVTGVLVASADVRVRVLDRGGGEVRILLAGPRQPGSVVATWDGRDAAGRRAAAGPYTLAVSATTAQGTFEMRRSVSLDLQGVTPTGLRASSVYPVVDGYRDTTAFRFRLSGRATVWVHLYRPGASTPFRTIAAGQLQAGDAAVTWDGRDASGRAVAAGTYRVRVQARDPAAIVRYSAYGSVVVFGKRIARRTFAVTAAGVDYLAQSFRRDEAHAFIEPSSVYPSGVRLRVVGGTGSPNTNGPSATVYYGLTLPAATTADSLEVTVSYVREGIAPRVRVLMSGGKAPPVTLLDPPAGPVTFRLSAAALGPLAPTSGPVNAIVEITLAGTGSIDLASFEVTYRYGVLR